MNERFEGVFRPRAGVLPTARNRDNNESVETAGELFEDGTSIEVIRGSSGDLQLLVAKSGKHVQTASEIRYAGKLFAPPRIAERYRKVLALPGSWADYGSTTKLFETIYKTLTEVGVPPDAALGATYFTFASWFPEFLERAPVLSISGPKPEVYLLLDVLACLARHALPITGANTTSFARSLTLQPTLIIDGEYASKAFLTLLRASNRHAACGSGGPGFTDCCCPKAVYVGSKIDCFTADGALFVNLMPTRAKLPMLTARARSEMIRTFQPMLLSYRNRNFQAVEISDFDLPEFGSVIRSLARTFAAPIVDAPALQIGIRSLLLAQQERLREQHWRDELCVAVEAVLGACHAHEQRVYVGDLAVMASAIMAGRDERKAFEAREMGAVLRELGIPTKRFTEGFAITLTDQVRRRVHELARDFEVAAAQECLAGCGDCRAVFPAGGGASERPEPVSESPRPEDV